MPYRNISSEVRSRKAARDEPWLQSARSLLAEDWVLILMALAISVGLWYGVAEWRAPATIRLRGVPLTFLLPPDTDLSNEPVDEVEVTLTGSRQRLDDLNIGSLTANVDLSRYRLGERIARLTPESVKMELPKGVEIEKIEPASIPLRLEKRIERMIDVRLHLEGEPVAGHEVVELRSTPKQVRVRGAESRVAHLEYAGTETVSLDARRESFTARDVAIDINDAKVLPVDSTVTADITIREQQIERRFNSVRAIYQNDNPRRSTVNAVLRGARSAIENLNPADIEIIFSDKTTEPRLVVPPAAEGKISLVKVE